MPHCAIINCKNSTKIVSRVNGDISFHCFPRNPTVKQLWVEATGNKNWYPTKFSKICSIHFNEEYFTKTDKCRRLSKSAIPTIQVLKTTTREENEELQAMLDREAQTKTKKKKKKHRPLYHLDPDQMLPEVRALIARVHRYLQHEYEQLKVFFGGRIDLSVLENIVQRTAEATGVSERAVAAILDAHQTRAQAQQDTGTDHVEEKPQENTREYCIEALKVEMEEEEEEEAEHCGDEEMPVSVELSQTPTTTSVPQTSPPPHAGMSPHFLASSSHTDMNTGHHFLAQSSLAAQHYMSPPSPPDVNTGHHFLASSPMADGNDHRSVHPPLAEVKIEPADDDYPEWSSSTHHVTADSSRVVDRTEPPDDDSMTSQDENTSQSRHAKLNLKATERQRDTRQSRLSRAHKI